jgi:hypothetical protein
MSHLFFSYARNDAFSPFLKEFYLDLVRELRAKDGTLPASEADGSLIYLDASEIKLGAIWKPEIIESLQTCRAFLALCSPAYFNSDYCGKELAVFRRRLLAHNSETPPPLIFPVLWEVDERVKAALATHFEGIQYTQGEFGKVYLEEGLSYLLRQERTQYGKVLHFLAKAIVQTTTRFQGVLPPLIPFPSFDLVASPWRKVAEKSPSGRTNSKNRRLVGPQEFEGRVPSHFHGRSREIGLICEFASDRQKRVLTVSGRSGIGKTALVCRALKLLSETNTRSGLSDLDASPSLRGAPSPCRTCFKTSLHF